MKGKIIMSVLLAATLFVCSFARMDLSRKYPKYRVSDFEDIFSGKHAASLQVDNETRFDEYDIEPIDIHGDARYLFHSTFGTWSPTLSEVTAVLGQGCLRMPEEGYLYTIYPTVQGGRLVIFYENTRKSISDASLVACYYIENELTYSDFEKLKIGDSFSDLCKVDRTAVLYKNLYKTDNKYFDKTGFCTLHYLNDGLLTVVFETNGGIGKITDIIFDKDFAIQSGASYSPTFYAKLLPIDN